MMSWTKLLTGRVTLLVDEVHVPKNIPSCHWLCLAYCHWVWQPLLFEKTIWFPFCPDQFTLCWNYGVPWMVHSQRSISWRATRDWSNFCMSWTRANCALEFLVRFHGERRNIHWSSMLTYWINFLYMAKHQEVNVKPCWELWGRNKSSSSAFFGTGKMF